MQITEEWLRDKEACESGIDWWLAHGKSTVSETFKVIHTVPQNGRWLIENSLDRVQSIKLAIFCAELVGGDKKAIDAAKAVLANDCEETRDAAYAAYAAVAAADAAADYAAYTADAAAAAAADAAYDAYKQIFNYASELTNVK